MGCTDGEDCDTVGAELLDGLRGSGAGNDDDDTVAEGIGNIGAVDEEGAHHNAYWQNIGIAVKKGDIGLTSGRGGNGGNGWEGQREKVAESK